MPAGDQAREAEGALKGMFQIVIASVDRLVIGVAAGETLDGPIEGARHERPVSIGKKAEVNPVHVFFDLSRDSGINVIQHWL